MDSTTEVTKRTPISGAPIEPTVRATPASAASKGNGKTVESVDTWNQPTPKSSKVKATPKWLEQWVLQLDVNPLSIAIRRSGLAVDTDRNKRQRMEFWKKVWDYLYWTQTTKVEPYD
jgi:hypothetical protein